jgi:hypothetical protein
MGVGGRWTTVSTMRDRSDSFIVLLLLTGLAASGHLVACDVVGADSTDEPRRTRDRDGDSVCGDWVIDGDEDCEEDDLGGATCVGLGFGDGVVTCGPRCTLDLSGCSAAATCGDDVIDEIGRAHV